MLESARVLLTYIKKMSISFEYIDDLNKMTINCDNETEYQNIIKAIKAHGNVRFTSHFNDDGSGNFSLQQDEASSQYAFFAEPFEFDWQGFNQTLINLGAIDRNPQMPRQDSSSSISLSISSDV